MAVDLSDLVPNLLIELNPPGENLYPEVTEAQWTEILSNAFWSARMDGLFPQYREFDGLVTPVSGTTDMPRELQQVIVFYAAYDKINQKLLGLRSVFRAKAGPVEYEVQQSAQVLAGLAQSLRERRNLLLSNLTATGAVNTYVIDSILARNESLALGESWWVS